MSQTQLELPSKTAAWLGYHAPRKKRAKPAVIAAVHQVPSNYPVAYVRDDGADMIEVEPHIYVNSSLLHLARR